MTGDSGREGGGDGSGGQLSVGGGDGDGGGGGRRQPFLPIAIFSKLICSLGVYCVLIVAFQSRAGVVVYIYDQFLCPVNALFRLRLTYSVSPLIESIPRNPNI